MNSLVTLVLLGQIIGCTFSVSLLEEFDCNGEEAKKFGDLAVHYINKHNLHGYKQTLNVIKSVDFLAPRPRTPIETVVAVELELLETGCHVLDPTPVENCTVRQQHDHAVKAECVVRIHRENGDKVSGANCHSKPDSVENVRRNCLKCPILLPLSDPHVLQLVEYVLNKYNEKHPEHAYEVLEISRGQHKYEPEAFILEFAIVETTCSAQEAHDDHHECHPKAAGEAHVGFCKATVFRSHGALEKPKDEQYELDCDIFDVKEGHSHTHLIEHHYGKNIASPGHNNVVLDLAHSHNHTSSSHESHSHEHVVEVAVPLAKREAPTEIVTTETSQTDTLQTDTAPTETAPTDTNAAPLCPGKVHHFKL